MTPTRANLPDFTRRLHRDVSCALHELLCREKYDAPRELWDDRQTHQMRLLDGAAQASQMVYGRLNGVAAGLVDDPDDMPLVNTTFGMWKTRYLVVERPPVYFEDTRPEQLRLELTPPPLLYLDFGGDLDRLIYHLDRLTDDGARKILAARTRPAMGADATRRLHPWSEPRTMRESGGRRIVPTFRIGAPGFFERERATRRRERKSLRFGTLITTASSHGGVATSSIDSRSAPSRRASIMAPRSSHVRTQAPCSPCPVRSSTTSLVCLPTGASNSASPPMQSSTKFAKRSARKPRPSSKSPTSTSRCRADADRARLRPTTLRPATRMSLANGDTERPEPEVRHRFDRRRPGSLDRAPRRLIIHRDRRARDRRPPSPSGKHGSDPPDE